MKFPEIDSPFATFEGGSGYVLPNDLPYMAHDALQRLKGEPASDVLPSLLKSGRMSLVHGMQAKDAHNVWNFFIWYYLTETGDETPSIAVRIKLLDLMLSYSPDAARTLLRSYISRISTIFLAGFAPFGKKWPSGNKFGSTRTETTIRNTVTARSIVLSAQKHSKKRGSTFLRNGSSATSGMFGYF